MRAVLALVVLGVVFVCGLSPSKLSFDQCGPIYRHYCHAQGMRATYVEGKRINDSLSMDATLLEALTDQAWADLLEDFAIPKLTTDSLSILGIDSIHTTIRYVSKQSPRLGADSVLANNNVVLVSHHKHMLCVFEPENEDQIHAIFLDFWFRRNSHQPRNSQLF